MFRYFVIFLVLIVVFPQHAFADQQRTRIQRQIETQHSRQDQAEQNNKMRLQKQKSQDERKYDREIRQQEQRLRQIEQRTRTIKQDNKSRLNKQKNRAKKRLNDDTASSRFND